MDHSLNLHRGGLDPVLVILQMRASQCICEKGGGVGLRRSGSAHCQSINQAQPPRIRASCAIATQHGGSPWRLNTDNTSHFKRYRNLAVNRKPLYRCPWALGLPIVEGFRVSLSVISSVFDAIAHSLSLSRYPFKHSKSPFAKAPL